jgi:hypothetical protein
MLPQIHRLVSNKIKGFTEAAQKILCSPSVLYSYKDITAVLHREAGDAVAAVVEGRHCSSQAAMTNNKHQYI